MSRFTSHATFEEEEGLKSRWNRPKTPGGAVEPTSEFLDDLVE
jgi:hypothetical protein